LIANILYFDPLFEVKELQFGIYGQE
jgi:hypothetical protein